MGNEEGTSSMDATSLHCESTKNSTSFLLVVPSSYESIQIRTCDKYDPVSGAPCNGNPLKPNHYVDCPTEVGGGTTTTISFNSDTQYLSFIDGDVEIRELWAKNEADKWPAKYELPAKPPVPAPVLLSEGTVPQLDCSFADLQTYNLTLDHPDDGNIKIRTCRTGLGCTGDAKQWNSFKDCDREIGSKQTISLKFEQKVAYILFYNTKTKQEEELWRPKTGPWPASYTLKE